VQDRGEEDTSFVSEHSSRWGHAKQLNDIISTLLVSYSSMIMILNILQN
jgi:hypothetical protein